MILPLVSSSDLPSQPFLREVTVDHEYTSTWCLHGECGTCKTVRLTCKTCGTICRHGCHHGEPVEPPVVEHVYYSTYCVHGHHEACKNTCVVCHAPCTCECHFDRPAGPTQPSITCPRCGRTSWHPVDVKMGYCGNCHDWTAETENT